jgi:hypothetical protein
MPVNCSVRFAVCDAEASTSEEADDEADEEYEEEEEVRDEHIMIQVHL